MKVLNSFIRHAYLMMAVCLSLGVISCNNEEENFSSSKNNTSLDVEVTKMSDWLPGTRSVSDNSADMPVLHFPNEQIYNQTIETLSNMTKEERDTYFEKLGFDGAYTLWNQADEELEQIFDTEDTLRIEKLINDYKVKYGNVFSFNTVDPYDVTPYLTFTDNELSLVGNIQGYVVVGNTLKVPEIDTPTYDIDEEIASTRAIYPGPIQPGFKGFKDASLTIKNGKYRSTMTIGRIENGNSFAVEFKTKKKVLFWKKSVAAGYSADLAMHSSKLNHRNRVFCPYGKKVSILNLRIETVGNIFDANVDNFTSSRGNTVGRQSFKNIRVI